MRRVITQRAVGPGAVTRVAEPRMAAAPAARSADTHPASAVQALVELSGLGAADDRADQDGEQRGAQQPRSPQQQPGPPHHRCCSLNNRSRTRELHRAIGWQRSVISACWDAPEPTAGWAGGFTARPVKQVLTDSTGGRRGTRNGRYRHAPAACLPWRRPQTLSGQPSRTTPQPTMSVCLRARTARRRTWPDAPGSTVS